MNELNLTGRLEALLFIYGEPLPFKKIAKTLNVKEEEVQEAVKKLQDSLRESGLWLVSDEEKVQLTTRPEFAKLLEQMIKEELKEDLSPASLETLSIIAYSSPVSRAELDYVRGVNSSFILRSLLLRGLIERELDPKRGNAFIYRPSLEFLKFMGIASANDLPEFEKLSKLINAVRRQENTDSGTNA
ncbi:MAG: SMC-Scp complex subunit ScpB [Patescibacteria group bacterium]